MKSDPTVIYLTTGYAGHRVTSRPPSCLIVLISLRSQLASSCKLIENKNGTMEFRCDPESLPGCVQ